MPNILQIFETEIVSLNGVNISLKRGFRYNTMVMQAHSVRTILADTLDAVDYIHHLLK